MTGKLQPYFSNTVHCLQFPATAAASSQLVITLSVLLPLFVLLVAIISRGVGAGGARGASAPPLFSLGVHCTPTFLEKNLSIYRNLVVWSQNHPRIALRAPNFAKFSGGACPQTSLAGHVPTERARTLRLRDSLPPHFLLPSYPSDKCVCYCPRV